MHSWLVGVSLNAATPNQRSPLYLRADETPGALAHLLSLSDFHLLYNYHLSIIYQIFKMSPAVKNSPTMSSASGNLQTSQPALLQSMSIFFPFKTSVALFDSHPQASIPPLRRHKQTSPRSRRCICAAVKCAPEDSASLSHVQFLATFVLFEPAWWHWSIWTYDIQRGKRGEFKLSSRVVDIPQ